MRPTVLGLQREWAMWEIKQGRRAALLGASLHVLAGMLLFYILLVVEVGPSN